MKGPFVIYVLRNPKNKRYIGITSNLSERLRQHNDGFSRFTKGKGPWNLEWSSRIMDHKEALIIEKLMKKQKGGMGLQRLLIENRSEAHNPA
ncbi:GIY-YIG nuclease family protein [Candidatus Peregrinibacteria bacterium]|nr:GIY-YIG nuclease family protein [Candidatus Peregrinibacteria bacterium]